jgi:phosphoglycolate phosphatase
MLFDIDGTLLLRASREHIESMHAALRAIHGIAEPPHVEAAGRTDVEIARTICTLAGVPAVAFDDRLDDLKAAVAEEYARRVPDSLADRVAPGVPELLHRLSERPEVRLSLVTGNVEPVARLKLRAAGIGTHFPAGQGGFGSDHEDRVMLPPIARARAGAPGEPHPREQTVVVGDTPRDIACAHADGLRCVAVASGPYAEAELTEADVVVPSALALPSALDELLG